MNPAFHRKAERFNFPCVEREAPGPNFLGGPDRAPIKVELGRDRVMPNLHQSTTRRFVSAAGRFERKPDPPLSLVDPDFDEALRSHIALLAAVRVSLNAGLSRG